MLNRTKGKLLLTLLVITGLASQVSKDTLNGRERRYLVQHLKETKAAFLGSIRGLTREQLSFRPAPGQWSVQECIQHLALSEDGLWTMAEKTLQQPPNPEKRSEIRLSDADLATLVAARDQKAKAAETLQPARAPWPTAAAAADHFKKQRDKTIRYIKTTTEDMRSHVTQMGAGPADAYQVVLILSAHTARHTAQIEEIKAHPAFPK